MDKNLEKLHEIDAILAKLVDGNDLTAEEAEELFYHIFLYDTEGYHLATLIGAIHAKGETADELLGFVNSYRKLGTKINMSADKVIDLSGTGGGSFKTINVSTAASFIVAAAGYKVAKQAFYGVTSPTGSADIFMAFGIDISKITKEVLEDTLKEIGICPFFASFMSPGLANINRIDKKIFVDKQVRVLSPFHLATNIHSPVNLKCRVYGCYSEKYLEVLAGLFKKLGFKRSLTFYAEIGLPEISNVGKTTIVEQNGNDIKKYVVEPKDVGVAEAKEEAIKTGGKEQNIIDFIEILKGKQKGAKSDLVAVNAGAAFYALEDVKTIADGTKKAQEILKTGEGYKKFEQLIDKIGSPELLKKYQ